MSSRPYHKRYHSDALAGFMALTLEERGAYQTLLDMMYDRQGPLLDNDRLLAGYMGVSVRKWKSIRETLLAKGKIHLTEDGLIYNSRAEKEIENDAKTTRKLAENGSKGGRKKAENAAQPAENRQNGLAGLEQEASLPDTRVQNNPLTPLDDQPIQTEGGGRVHAFAGRTIRLTGPDLESWIRAYHAIPDLLAELRGIDQWMQEGDDPAKRQRNWFMRTAKLLQRRHDEALAAREAQQAEDDAFFRRYPEQTLSVSDARAMMGDAEFSRWCTRHGISEQQAPASAGAH